MFDSTNPIHWAVLVLGVFVIAIVLDRLFDAYLSRRMNTNAPVLKAFESAAIESGVLAAYRENPLTATNKDRLQGAIDVYCADTVHRNTAFYTSKVMTWIRRTKKSLLPSRAQNETQKLVFYQHFLYLPLREYLESQYKSALAALRAEPTSIARMTDVRTLGGHIIDAANTYKVTPTDFDSDRISSDILHHTAVHRAEVIEYLLAENLMNAPEFATQKAILDEFQQALRQNEGQG